MVRDIQEMDPEFVLPKEADNHRLIVQNSNSLSKRNQLVRQDAFDLGEPPDTVVTRKKTVKDNKEKKTP